MAGNNMRIVAENKSKARIGLFTLLAMTLALLAACATDQAKPPESPPQVEKAVAEPASPAPDSSAPGKSTIPGPQDTPSEQAASSQSESEPASEPVAKAATSESTQNAGSDTEAKTEPAASETSEGIDEPIVNLDEVDAVDDIFFLEILSPEEDPTFAESSTFTVFGRTRVDAAVSVNDELVDVDQDGIIEAEVSLEEGPNVIEIVASISGGQEESAVLTVFYIP